MVSWLVHRGPPTSLFLKEKKNASLEAQYETHYVITSRIVYEMSMNPRAACGTSLERITYLDARPPTVAETIATIRRYHRLAVDAELIGVGGVLVNAGDYV